MSTYSAIEKNIIDITEIHMEAGEGLHAKFNLFSSASWSQEELEANLKGDEDVCTEFNITDDDGVFPDIRNVQDMMINFFAE